MKLKTLLKMIKKLSLLSVFGFVLVGQSYGQQEVTEKTLPLKFQKVVSAQKGAAVTDTIVPPFTCTSQNQFLTIITNGNNQIITGTYNLGSGNSIEMVGQALNTSGNSYDVYSLMALTVYKEEGPTKGSFTAAIYDTTGGIAATPMATSNPVTFDNVNDTNTTGLITRFEFPTPVSVNAPFWATVDVDNGSDTISLASTANGCGGASIFKASANTNWSTYEGAFSSGGNGIKISVQIWAEVETKTVGLDRNFLSRSGLKFYPNPAKDFATIEYDLEGEKDFTLNIQDMTGRVVYSKSYRTEDEGKLSIDLSTFNNGVYTYQLVGSQQQLNGVFVKE